MSDSEYCILTIFFKTLDGTILIYLSASTFEQMYFLAPEDLMWSKPYECKGKTIHITGAIFNIQQLAKERLQFSVKHQCIFV